ncbi:NADH dehydrogenase [ubiquinone] 1 alpha subcomplex subunit 8-like [Pectinophora gossypiella]|uniref:NADH dehydrogenase [ubiquinone] 1 alpha subcomplex subunit 8-like n=1 Tax=Pectinophora gossypiella TaxID=13191 RepID=UPI00214E2241|nr:NADH dehydrogenase [ubiquinone] 1 alpha subcomplex subunit 8-like [Pectinophora gossypiella]
MVITKETELPEFEQLKVEHEVDLSTATLMAAAPYLGKYCESINNEFMLCRYENQDPRPCVELGKIVTKCTIEFFKRVKKNCLHEHNQYTNCIDKSSGNYKPWFCRKTHAVYEECMREKLCIDYPGFGYFTRGRIHTSKCTDPPEELCPCVPSMDDETRHLPDCKPRLPPRFSSRLYWITE